MAKFKKNSKNQNRKLQGTPVGKKKYNQKNKVVSKIKKKALKPTVTRKIGDARNVLHAKSRKQMLATDARDKLAKIAKGTDARQKLEKIRNLKEGKFDVKKTAKGGITIVTTTQGQLQLTTKKKEAAKNRPKAGTGKQVVRKDKVSKIGKNLTKSVNPAGKITLSTKAKTTALSASSSVKNTIKKKQPTNSPRQPAAKMQVAKKQPMSRAARLDGK